MAKLIKSIFQPSERRKSRYEETDDDKCNSSPPMEERRKLSISRSGRMKPNKKRLSLSLDVYGQEVRGVEKQGKEYIAKKTNKEDSKRKQSRDLTPEEEIDNAFGNIAA